MHRQLNIETPLHSVPVAGFERSSRCQVFSFQPTKGHDSPCCTCGYAFILSTLGMESTIGCPPRFVEECPVVSIGWTLGSANKEQPRVQVFPFYMCPKR